MARGTVGVAAREGWRPGTTGRRGVRVAGDDRMVVQDGETAAGPGLSVAGRVGALIRHGAVAGARSRRRAGVALSRLCDVGASAAASAQRRLECRGGMAGRARDGGRVGRVALFPLLLPFVHLVSDSASVAAQSYQRGRNVAPAFEGWERNDDGSYSFLFGYMNRNWSQKIDVPVGEHNGFSPGPADRGQPTHFLPRRNRFVFKVRVPADWGDRELVWTLTTNGVTERAYATLRPDYIVDNTVVMSETGALGAGSSNAQMRSNQPPTVTVEGPDVHEVVVGQSVTLTALVEDDGLLRSRRRTTRPPATAADSARADSIWSAPPTLSRRQLTPPSRITVQKVNGLFMSWFLYRGEGVADGAAVGADAQTGKAVGADDAGVGAAVAFDTPQIKVWEDTRAGANSPWAPLWVPPELPEDGRWTVTVTFDRPGRYVLRGRADDGGLYTDVEVTVVVRPAVG